MNPNLEKLKKEAQFEKAFLEALATFNRLPELLEWLIRSVDNLANAVDRRPQP